MFLFNCCPSHTLIALAVVYSQRRSVASAYQYSQAPSFFQTDVSNHQFVRSFQVVARFCCSLSASDDYKTDDSPTFTFGHCYFAVCLLFNIKNAPYLLFPRSLLLRPYQIDFSVSLIFFTHILCPLNVGQFSQSTNYPLIMHDLVMGRLFVFIFVTCLCPTHAHFFFNWLSANKLMISQFKIIWPCTQSHLALVCAPAWTSIDYDHSLILDALDLLGMATFLRSNYTTSTAIFCTFSLNGDPLHLLPMFFLLLFCCSDTFGENFFHFILFLPPHPFLSLDF